MYKYSSSECSMGKMVEMPKLHIVMFPWFAFGHMNPYLLLSNELAKRGNKVSFFIPNKAIKQLQDSNHYPHLITFYPITVPHVDGIPIGTETASEIPLHLNTHLATAIDLARPQVSKLLSDLKPDLVFYDFSYWVPEIAKKVGFKTVCYNVVCAAILVRNTVACRKPPLTTEEMAMPPPGYPSTTVVLLPCEGNVMSFSFREFGSGITFNDRLMTSFGQCDVIAIRTCQELEGKLCNYLSAHYQKPLLLTGPVLAQSEDKPLEEKWDRWLNQFEPGSVLFCTFGSQWVLEKDEFQELVLGFELTGVPFLVALKPPVGVSSMEEALPEGFKERVKERGLVYDGWVQQLQILSHKSVGCFVTHCGFGSMWESLLSDCQIVLVPHLADQILNTRLLSDELKVAVEVDKDENGWFSKEDVCKAVKSVMDNESELGSLVRTNHGKWRDTFLSPGFISSYIDKFIQKLYDI